LSETFPWLKPLYDGVNRNRQNWQDLAEKVDMGLTWIDYDVIEKPVEEFSSMTQYDFNLKLRIFMKAFV
jgi:cGMP-specific 3',5'-cyclic phosphodiesterase